MKTLALIMLFTFHTPLYLRFVATSDYVGIAVAGISMALLVSWILDPVKW